jgi:hypothetical protein
MPDTTPEQRAKIGQLKAAAQALVEDMVQEFQDYPERMSGVQRVALATHHHRPLSGERWSRSWLGSKLT